MWEGGFKSKILVRGGKRVNIARTMVYKEEDLKYFFNMAKKGYFYIKALKVNGIDMFIFGIIRTSYIKGYFFQGKKIGFLKDQKNNKR